MRQWFKRRRKASTTYRLIAGLMIAPMVLLCAIVLGVMLTVVFSKAGEAAALTLAIVAILPIISLAIAFPIEAITGRHILSK